MINIALVEDDNELREHLRTYFDSQKEFKCSFSVDSAENLLGHLKTSEPDIILMDIGLPGMSGIEAMKLVRKNTLKLK
ncbi:MAG TPA: response regulator [Ignavibacteriaceae bacterium]|nr:response regulator [Ignavibacteriaceae bacterium]